MHHFLLIDALGYLDRIKGILDIHNTGYWLPFEKVRQREKQVLESKLNKAKTEEIQATARAELKAFVQSFLARRTSCWQLECFILSQRKRMQTKRLLRQAKRFVDEAHEGYGLCPMTPLVQVDILAQMAKVHTS